MIKENQRTLNQINGLTDVLILFPCMVLAYVIRFVVFQGEPGHIGLSYYIYAVLCMSPLFWLLYGLMGLYDSFRAKNFLTEFSLLIRCNLLLFGLLLAFFFVFKEFHLSRWTLLIFFVLATMAVSAKRWLLRRVLRAFREKGYNLKHVLLVGCGEQAQMYYEAIQRDRTLGLSVDHYLAPHDCLPGLSYLGTYEAFPRVLERISPDEVVIALEADEYRYLPNIIMNSEKNGVKVSLIPFYNKYMPSHPVFDEVGGVSLVNIRHIPLDNIGNAFLKRTMDIVGSLLLIVLLYVYLFVRSGGRALVLSRADPVRQERVGLNKKPFYMYKFRSMRVNDKQTTGWSTNSDPRKTRFGAFIRKFSIDELPQFFNVLKGDMSLVGPRPELPYFVNQFKETVPLYMVKHQVRPGSPAGRRSTASAAILRFRGVLSTIFIISKTGRFCLISKSCS